jgi:hypothetical protein
MAVKVVMLILVRHSDGSVARDTCSQCWHESTGLPLRAVTSPALGVVELGLGDHGGGMEYTVMEWGGVSSSSVASSSPL